MGGSIWDVFPDRMRMLADEFPSVKLFADMMGVDKYTIYHYIQGKGLPRAEILRDVCLNCGVTADWLLGITNDPGRMLFPWKEGRA